MHLLYLYNISILLLDFYRLLNFPMRFNKHRDYINVLLYLHFKNKAVQMSISDYHIEINAQCIASYYVRFNSNSLLREVPLPICHSPCLECHVDILRNGFQLSFALQAYWVAFVYRPRDLLRILITLETLLAHKVRAGRVICSL